MGLTGLWLAVMLQVYAELETRQAFLSDCVSRVRQGQVPMLLCTSSI